VLHGGSDPRVLTAVQPLALVRIKLRSHFGFRIIFQGLARRELSVAVLTDADCPRRGFYDSKVARWHETSFAQEGRLGYPLADARWVYIFHMAETLAELKTDLALLEKHLSRICQHADMDKAVTECANKIAAIREKIKKAEAGQ
jgi:hypothetical protein